MKHSKRVLDSSSEDDEPKQKIPKATKGNDSAVSRAKIPKQSDSELEHSNDSADEDSSGQKSKEALSESDDQSSKGKESGKASEDSGDSDDQGSKKVSKASDDSGDQGTKEKEPKNDSEDSSDSDDQGTKEKEPKNESDDSSDSDDHNPKDKKETKNASDDSSNSESKKTKRKSSEENKKITRMKRYFKTAGIRIHSYAVFWEGCKSNQAKVRKMLEYLREKGLKSKPTLESCRKLRAKIEKRSEVAELDLENIIDSNGGRPRRSGCLTNKPAPLKEKRVDYSRIKALADSDSD